MPSSSRSSPPPPDFFRHVLRALMSPVAQACCSFLSSALPIADACLLASVCLRGFGPMQSSCTEDMLMILASDCCDSAWLWPMWQCCEEGASGTACVCSPFCDCRAVCSSSWWETQGCHVSLSANAFRSRGGAITAALGGSGGARCASPRPCVWCTVSECIHMLKAVQLQAVF